MLKDCSKYNIQEIDSYHLKSEDNYTELIILLTELNTSKEINDLMQFTVINRIMILDLNSSNLFSNIIKNINTPYSSNSTEISMHLNSFYFHISGLIDNLAWYMEYSLNLMEIKIDDSTNRNKIGLHKKKNKDFMNKLRDKNIEIFDLVVKYQDWFKELTEKRDPVAHRKPIYVPPTVLINDIEQFKPIAYLNDEFISILDTLFFDNKQLFNLCTSLVKLVELHSIKT